MSVAPGIGGNNGLSRQPLFGLSKASNVSVYSGKDLAWLVEETTRNSAGPD
jgi:hypothetical protein